MNRIQTFTGKWFYPLTPREQDVDIRDIAHALAMKCRFGGHCTEFYSVAEHAVRVSYVVPPELALWGLMHDAAEAYVADVPRPVKKQLHVHHAESIYSFEEAEDRVLAVIAKSLGFPTVEYSAVEYADTTLLATEVRDLMVPPLDPWNLGVDPLPERIIPWPASQAERAFLACFAELHPPAS